MEENDYRYSDIDLDFEPNPITRDISLKYDAESIKRSLRNLIFTRIYERFFQPDLYGGMYDILFENFTPIQVVVVQNRLEDLILNYEPRISSANVTITENFEGNSIFIEIDFLIVNRINRDQLTIEAQRVR